MSQSHKDHLGSTKAKSSVEEKPSAHQELDVDTPDFLTEREWYRQVIEEARRRQRKVAEELTQPRE